MIKTIDRILSDEELQYLLSKCEHFVKNNEKTPDGKNWFYNSMHLWDDSKLTNLRFRLLEFVGDGYQLQYNGIFINKIVPHTNINDGYHIDSSDLSIVMFLNDDFEGGEFEYYKNSKQLVKIKPDINTSILLNKEIVHRVLPIKSGVRYSLIIWFQVINKNFI